MNRFAISAVLALAAGCTTPMTTLKNKSSGQVATCGGSSTGSWVGGAIGHEMQKDSDAECVATYKKQGFTVIDRKE